MHRAAALLLLALSLEAQSLQINVKDPSGAPLQATGKLTGPATLIFRTDPTGQYTAANLPLGQYNLEISNSGFTTQSLSIDIQSEATVTRIITLALASTAYKVDVVAPTPLPGSELALNQVPSPVQTATKTDIDNSAALDLGDFMNRRLNGV